MSEWRIERHLVDECKRLGLLCLKLKAEGRRGFPDRTIFGPNAEIFFVETKTEDGELSKQQEQTIGELRELGYLVSVPKTIEEVDENIVEILKQIELSKEISEKLRLVRFLQRGKGSK